MTYAKPGGLLLSKPVKRKAPKSDFLTALEEHQADPTARAYVGDRSVDPAFDDSLLPALLRAQA